MKYILTFLLFALTAPFTIAQVVSDANAEKRAVSGFHAIKVSDGIDLYLSQGNEEAVAVSASNPEHRNKIKTEVRNGVLWISFEWKTMNILTRDRKLKAYVSIKTIDGLEASGGSDVEIKGSLNSNSLKIDLSGGSDFSGSVNATDLKMGLSGASDVEISGKVSKLNIHASGGSDFAGFGLEADYISITASGGSDMEITGNKEVSVQASGGSDVHYKGAAVIKSVNTSGGSSVKRI